MDLVSASRQVSAEEFEKLKALKNRSAVLSFILRYDKEEKPVVVFKRRESPYEGISLVEFNQFRWKDPSAINLPIKNVTVHLYVNKYQKVEAIMTENKRSFFQKIKELLN